MQKLPAKKREKLAMFIIEYALNETEPDTKDSTLLATFAIIRPILDSGRIKAQAGKMGGSASGEVRKANPKQNEAKLKQNEANPKQEQEQEQEQEQVQGEEQEQGQCFPREITAEGFPEVLMTLRVCGIELSDQERADCERLCAQYGRLAILDAIDRAKEANVPRWSYIRAIVTSGGVSRGGGVSRRVRESNAQVQRHGEISPGMLAAAKQMLEEVDL